MAAPAPAALPTARALAAEAGGEQANPFGLDRVDAAAEAPGDHQHRVASA